MRLGGELGPTGQECRRQIRCAEVLEVHGEKGDVVQHVSVAESIGELDAIEDPRAVRQDEDVVRE